MTTGARFELKRVTTSEWLVLDVKYPPGDLCRTVACVYETGPADVDVTWLRDLPLASRYRSVRDVLDDVRGLYSRRLVPAGVGTDVRV